ncbi:MAG TPA: universal stress protein [Chloroflexi bacterium]|nr:universal stress protein [Chloroflexota bacterium]
MGKILCSTRGGEASIRTQKAAIQRAKETGDELIFFYVVDVEFLAQADYAMRSDVVTGEMDKMADFLMAMAVERAEKEGIKARYLIRHGNFVKELEETVREEGITLVVLGRPADNQSAFKLATLQELARKLEEDLDVEVWIPD